MDRYFWIGSPAGSFNCECSPTIRAGADPVDPALCNRPCPGNPNQICGGVGVGSLYVQNCFNPNPNQAQVRGVGVIYNYAGCFEGQSIPGLQRPETASTLEECASFCGNFGAPVFGMAVGSTGPGVCSCGGVPGDRYQAADVRCTAPCTSNDEQRCGGTNGLNLYALPGVAVSTASRVCTSVTTTSTTTVTNTATATATAPEGTVTNVCARSTITATGKASTTTITVVPTKRYTSTCYRTTTKTVSSKCRPPKSRYARETAPLVARQDPETCTISNGQVTVTTTTTTVTPITVTATPPDVTVCSTSTVTVTKTPTSTVTKTNTKSPVKKYYTTTSMKTVTTTKYPKYAPTCKKKRY
ncbi:unnamed protein product [Cercospora beticola]|nr:unnamed protein product [Cercospora beticola]